MIYDIKKLIDVADFRDEILKTEFEERMAGLRREREELEAQNTADQKEIRKRARELVDRIEYGAGDVTRTELQTWFTTDGNRPMGRAMQVIYRNDRAQENTERNYAATARPGELQAWLRSQIEQGVRQVIGEKVRQAGFRYELRSWQEKYDKARIRKVYGA